MRICWDNLENVYLSRRGEFRQNAKISARTLYIKVCEECGEEYLGMKKTSRYCSNSCVRKNKTHTNFTRKKMSISKIGYNNPNFGKAMPEEIKVKIGKANTGKIKSEKCKLKIGEANRGRIVSTETRQKISAANTGRVKSKEECIKLSIANTGKSHSAETKRKISLAKKGKFTGKDSPNYGKKASDKTRLKLSKLRKGKRLGSKNPAWNPKLTDEDRAHKRISQEYKDWRQNVYKRDRFTCKNCGNNTCVLHAHHIKNYKDNTELRYDIDNGVTLCSKCHIEFHKLFGKEDNNIEQLTVFFNKF